MLTAFVAPLSFYFPFYSSVSSPLVFSYHPLYRRMAARPTITVWSDKGESSGSLPLPAVFTAPIRLDVVQQVHSKLQLFFLHPRRGKNRFHGLLKAE